MGVKTCRLDLEWTLNLSAFLLSPSNQNNRFRKTDKTLIKGSFFQRCDLKEFSCSPFWGKNVIISKECALVLPEDQTWWIHGGSHMVPPDLHPHIVPGGRTEGEEEEEELYDSIYKPQSSPLRASSHHLSSLKPPSDL